jgi:hypothetical protein
MLPGPAHLTDSMRLPQPGYGGMEAIIPAMLAGLACCSPLGSAGGTLLWRYASASPPYFTGRKKERLEGPSSRQPFPKDCRWLYLLSQELLGSP